MADLKEQLKVLKNTSKTYRLAKKRMEKAQGELHDALESRNQAEADVRGSLAESITDAMAQGEDDDE